MTNNGRASAPAIATAQPFSPGFFTYQSTWVVATTPDYRVIGDPARVPGTVPAKPGDTIILWGTGFGPTNPPIPNGIAISGAPSAAAQPVLLIGGIFAPVAATVMSPGSAGLYQIAVTVPRVPDGDSEVLANAAGYSSPQGYTIYVRAN